MAGAGSGAIAGAGAGAMAGASVVAGAAGGASFLPYMNQPMINTAMISAPTMK